MQAEFCQFCRKETGIQCHHPDYNKPYEVMWLCGSCHMQWHGKNKAIPVRGEVGVKTKLFNFEITPPLHKKLKLASVKSGLSMGEILTTLVTEYLEGK